MLSPDRCEIVWWPWVAPTQLCTMLLKTRGDSWTLATRVRSHANACTARSIIAVASARNVALFS